MIDLCKRIAPGSIDDISAINALYRPGPLESGMVDEFIEIKHGRKQTQYPFPSLEPVLRDTYGVIIYQEQVMNVARIVAGYSLGQADMLRRAMGKKKADEMAHHREIFLKGAAERNYDTTVANELFDKMEKFAEYGFNKSHAVAYSVISYQTAWLKYYYPAEFFAALLSSELGSMDKVTQYISDAKHFDIDVLPPSINESIWPFNVVGKNIRFGMGAVKNVGENAVEEIVRERTENGPYTGFLNFCERVNLKVINTRVFESLIKVGAFDECEKMNRKTLLENLEMILAYCKKRQEEASLGLVSLFDLGEENMSQTAESNLDIQEVRDFDDLEKLSHEAELMGIYISGHPLDRYKNLMQELSTMPVAQVQDFLGSDQKRSMTLAGQITARKNIITKKGDKMCFATLEDLSGKIECIVFPKVFAEYELILNTDEPVLVEGYVNLQENPRKIFAEKILKLKEHSENKITGVRINVDLTDLTEMKLNKLRQVLLSYRGATPMHLIFEGPGGKARLPLGEEFLINPTPQMAHQINEVFNRDAVKFVIDGRLEDVHVQ
jgi:DNA polymerase-3 subunit alpha